MTRSITRITVGATHWEEGGSTDDLPGAKPAFFFAPRHIAKREQEWGYFGVGWCGY